METLCIKSIVGELTVFEDGGRIIALDWGRGLDTPRTTANTTLNRAAEALRTYFQSGIDDFDDLPLDPGGTPFQNRVWSAMRKIPHGEVRTYGEVAKLLGSSPRAVGTACGANPIPILIPCHRIVGKASLGGYSGDGGLDTKRDLLRLEGYI